MSKYEPTGPGPRYLKMQDVVDKTSLHRATIYRLIAVGDFPQGTLIRPRRRAWTETSVDDWLAERELAEI